MTSEPAHSVGGELVYAIGDVHGCYEQLRALLAAIERDADIRAGHRRPILIFCGDYVDRGPLSARVLDTLCWLNRHKPYEVRFLKGNHEQIMLDWLRDPVRASAWLRFGGMETLQSYGVVPPSHDSETGLLLAARDDLFERLPVAHLRFLDALELIITVGDYAFVHAGVRPGVAFRNQAEADLLWIRDEFLSDHSIYEKIVVHGHTWFDAHPRIAATRIGIDTGVYRTGVLTALCLENGEQRVIQAGPEPTRSVVKDAGTLLLNQEID